MGQWLADLFLGHIKLFSTELFWKKKIHFIHNFLQNSFQKIFKLLFLYIFLFFFALHFLPKLQPKHHNSVNLWYNTTKLFPIYPNIHWTIRRRDDHIVVPSSNRIKLKIDWIIENIMIVPNHQTKNVANLLSLD